MVPCLFLTILLILFNPCLTLFLKISSGVILISHLNSDGIYNKSLIELIGLLVQYNNLTIFGIC